MEAKDQEKSAIRLKGIGDSITVMLDPAQPFDFLKEELTRIFRPISHLAADARIVIDAGAQGANGELIRQLGEFLKTNYRVGTVTQPHREQTKAKELLRQKEIGGDVYHRRSDVLMMTGRVRSGQKIKVRKHFLLLGDVNPGGEITAGGDILIMGSLRGKAVAGQPDNEEAVILALDFRPTLVQIGGVPAAGLPEPSQKTAEFARVQDGRIVVEDYLKAYSFGSLPWPEIR
jgi:septum site-determining protein MinC